MNSFTILLKELREEKLVVCMIIAFGAISSAFKASATGLSQVLGNLIFKDSSLFNPESVNKINVHSLSRDLNIDPLYFTVFLLGLSFILANIFRYIFMTKIRFLAESKAVETREKLMSHYLSLDSNFRNELGDGSGGLISRILNDVLIYQNGFKKLSDLLKEPFLVLFSTIWLFIINWKIALFLILGLPPILFIIRRLAKSLRKHSKRNQETMESLTMTLKEGLDGARVIHSFQLERTILDKFKTHINNYLNTVKKIISREELSGPLTESISSIIFCGSFILVAFLVKTEGLTFGDFLGISVAVGFLTDAGKKTQNAFIQIQQSVVAKERIDKILDSKPNKYPDFGNKNFPKKINKIKIENLSVSFGDTQVLKNISFETDAQKTIALVGPSGSGKSTFLNCLDTFVIPDSGNIYFDEISLKEISPQQIKDNISLVSQDPFLFNTSVFENLKYAKKDLSPEEAADALKLANADFVLNLENGLDTEVGERGCKFSGGERQRISIARALIKNSPILLLDEATSALDTQSEKEVQKGLDSLKDGRTCFVVAHRLSTIKEADQILVFEHGKIIEQGNHLSLIDQKGLYTSLYQ